MGYQTFSFIFLRCCQCEQRNRIEMHVNQIQLNCDTYKEESPDGENISPKRSNLLDSCHRCKHQKQYPAAVDGTSPQVVYPYQE